MKRSGRNIYILIIILVFLCVILIVSSVFQSMNALTMSNYTLSSYLIERPIRVLQLSDLHNNVFQDNNGNLVKACADQDPDLILMTGDLINMDEEYTSAAEKLIADLTLIAPVYLSLGNHEMDYQRTYEIDLKSVFENAGATVLEKEYEDILINNQVVRLGGIYGYCLPTKFLKTNEADPEECAFLTDFQDTDRYTILMCHMPVCWMINEGLDEWDIDCVFSGHAHGGQIILPFIGGLYAPDMGFFPGDVHGVFHSKDNTKHLILSRGLGSGTWVPRINNRPEIVVVDIISEELVRER